MYGIWFIFEMDLSMKCILVTLYLTRAANACENISIDAEAFGAVKYEQMMHLSAVAKSGQRFQAI